MLIPGSSIDADGSYLSEDGVVRTMTFMAGKLGLALLAAFATLGSEHGVAS
jgi:hypothetical protein